MELHVLHLQQDDPKKCTARKLARFGLAALHTRISSAPGGAVLLDPFAVRAISREDGDNARKNGILAVDCSWEQAEEVFPKLRRRTRNYRALPVLLAANPVKYGKVAVLSTLEAFAAALYIMGEKERAAELMSIYKWGRVFLELNRQPLDDYAAARDSKGVVEAQDAYLDDEEDASDGWGDDGDGGVGQEGAR